MSSQGGEEQPYHYAERNSLALVELKRVTEVGLERVSGQMALVLQRMAQTEQRADADRSRMDMVATRVDMLERKTVTHEELTAKTSRVWAMLGVLLPVTVGLLSLLTLWLNR